MNRRDLLFVLPPLALLGAVVLPLALGHETFYLRDVLNAHLQMATSLADALDGGRLALVDVLRGGQPLLGNPNAAPLYPTRLLLLVASPLWVLNAHFWLHWLLAPWAMFALARAWGLNRRAAWAAGFCYATCGFFISLLNLHNLVAGAALLPAFVASVLALTRQNEGTRIRPTAVAATGLLWTLLLLAGDPLTAALAGGMAMLAVAFDAGTPRVLAANIGRMVTPLFAGSLIAAPQLVAFAQILPGSYRGEWGYSRESALAASWDPTTLFEWLVPFVFGRPDRSFWGQSFFGGNEPFYLTLFPGVLALALVVGAGRPRSRGAWWAWGIVAAGLFLALGAHNPLVNSLAGIGGGALRYPIKVWPMVAVGGALLTGFGFARLDTANGRRALGRVLGSLALLFAIIWWWLGHPSDGFRQLVSDLTGGGLTGQLLEAELQRWAALCFLQLVLVGMLLVALWASGRNRLIGGMLLLVLHTGSQLFFLQPARDTDATTPYRRAPPPWTLVDETSAGWTVHGGVANLFGKPPARPATAPDVRTLWDERRRFDQRFPQSGALRGIPYDLDATPEGLDAFLSVAFGQALRQQSDEGRLRLLAATGVDTLLLDRPLDPDAVALTLANERVTTNHSMLWAYRLNAAPPVSVASDVRYVANVNRALEELTDPTGNPATMAVLPGSEPDRQVVPSTLHILDEGPESLSVEVDGDGGVLLWQRAHLSIYRASIDGVRAEIVPGNVHRLAVPLPAGRHEVRIWVDHRPLVGSLIAAVIGIVLLLLVARRAFPR